MGRAFEISGDSLSYLLYASQLTALLVVLLSVVFPFDGTASVALALLFASLMVGTVVGLWRKWTGSDGFTHLGRHEDVTYDPFADPGQAAKERWEKAVRQLSDEDNERD